MRGIWSSHVQAAFAERACSTAELADFVARNLSAVVASYPAYDWQGVMPKSGVYRIDKIAPEKIFAQLTDNDPEYSFLQADGRLLLAVGDRDQTELPIELKAPGNSIIRTLGHTHPGSEANIDYPSERDLVQLLTAKNKSEFIFHRDGLLTFRAPEAQRLAQTPADLADRPTALANALYYNYIVEDLKLDETAFEKDPHGYWRKYCTEVFALELTPRDNAPAIAAKLPDGAAKAKATAHSHAKA